MEGKGGQNVPGELPFFLSLVDTPGDFGWVWVLGDEDPLAKGNLN